MKRWIAFLCVVVLLLGLTACGEKDDYAIKIGEKIVSENDYYRYIMLLRDNYLAAGNNAEDSVSFWRSASEKGNTHAEFLVETARDQLVNTKLYSIQFDRLELSFTEEEQARIDATLSEMVEARGGMSAFIEYLKGYNYTYEEYMEEYLDIIKKSKVLNYYYGTDGENPLSEKDIKDYYNVHNALVKIVYVLKVDSSTGEALTTEELAAAKERANEAYEAATRPSETDLFEDVISIFSDAKDSTDAVVISDNGTYEQTIYKPILALDVGEVTMLDLDSAYMIVKRYDGTAEDVFTATIRQAMVEEIRADDIAAKLDAWRKDVKVKLNKKIIKKYSPINLVGQ